ncbi:Tubulin_specific chaperone D [Hexamita inflata]|uniref:Tubulin specific chaperone D n=1 Tax=Hexamita inflata TaxID=28002 RepID=A0AA86UIU8_9EUKA|nr:Tubulin specific chaperone D [Hexamita inflata]
MQAQSTQDFLQSLRQIMQLTDETEIKSELASACERLQQLEYQTKILKMSAYEKRKFNNEYIMMQQNLAKVRQVKIPRKVFSFNTRKLIKQQEIQKIDAEEEVQYVDSRIIRNLQNQTIDLTKNYNDLTPELLQNKDVNIQNLENCVVILPNIETVYISNLKNCQVTSQKISSAFHVENATNCVFTVSAHQLRIHNCFQTTFVIEAGSAPIIEKCSELIFKKRDENGIRFFQEENKWKQIRDFSWLKNAHSPNFEVVE